MTEPSAARSALRSGRAFVDLAAWTKLLVRGSDARSWLGDLVTADVAGLAPGCAARSLLLSPTGRIRADFSVAALGDGFLLVQGPGQPRSVADLLAPYVLTSEVELEDRTAELTLVAFPGGEPSPDVPGLRSTPSSLGTGVDLIAARDRDGIGRAARAAGMEEAQPDAVEAWRVERGVARFPVDLTETSLPHEAALDHAIDHAKGCFLGQEAVAKVRNLGHPPRLVLAGRSPGEVAPGDPVLAGGREAGAVTSASALEEGWAVIFWVRWEARDGPMETADGGRLEVAGPASGP